MKIKLSKSKWEEMGKKAGWLGPEPRECNCGSGQIAEAEYDARGIFLTYACPKCKRQKLSKYRQDVLDNPNYEANEPIEPEASVKRVLKMAFEEKMMPGQTPYTKEEKGIKDNLIGDASRAEEIIGIDELEESTKTNPLDGMTKVKAVRTIRNLIYKYTKGIFSDTDWSNVNKIFAELNANNIPYVIKSADYRHNDAGVSVAKVWKFEIEFLNDRGRPSILYGYVTASGSGSVQDPLSKYDIVAIVS